MRLGRSELIALAIIWGIFAALSALAILSQNPGDGWLVVVLAIAAGVATSFVTDEQDRSSRADPKSKTQSVDPDIELLARLLDPADLDAIRAHIRTRLLDAADQRNDGEVLSLEDLLKRGRK